MLGHRLGVGAGARHPRALPQEGQQTFSELLLCARHHSGRQGQSSKAPTLWHQRLGNEGGDTGINNGHK